MRFMFLASFVAVTLDKILNEHLNVFFSLSQRWRLERKYVDPVEQIASKSTGFDGSGQITMSGRDYAYVCANCLIAAEPWL